MSKRLFYTFWAILGCIFTIVITIFIYYGINVWFIATIGLLTMIGFFHWFIYTHSESARKTEALAKVNHKLQTELRDREQFEEALYRNENKFRNFISNSPDGIVLTDDSGIVTEWNQALTDITGIKREDALGVQYWELRISLFPPSAEDINKLHYESLLDEGISATIDSNVMRETDIITRRGDSKIIQIKTFSIPGNTSFKIASLIRDVTDSKKKDREIEQTAERLRAIFDNTHQAFVFLDPSFRILDFNSIANSRAVYIFDSPLEKGEFVHNYFRPENQVEIKELLKAVSLGENVQTEINLRSGEEKEHWYEFHLAPVFNDEMYLIGVFVNFFDIQIRKQSENEIRNTLEKERELNRMKSQFVSSVSHEFRTPLASIYSNVQLLNRYYAKWDDSKREATFSRIYQSIKHMTSLLQDVSQLGKGQSGMQKFEPEMMDICALCQQIIDETESNFDVRGRIDFKTDLRDFEALVDVNLTKHIFINLLNNALKYSPKEELVLFELIFEQPNLLNFRIVDKGIGITEDDLNTIFEPFIRGRNVGSISGTGLGMAIVKQCVDVHNGAISITSIPGTGTTVIVKLPYKVNSLLHKKD